METKELIEKLRMCAGIAGCLNCTFEERSPRKDCAALLKKMAVDHLEELENENEFLKNGRVNLMKECVNLKKQLSEKQNEWHSVKDDPPKEKGNYFAYNEKNDRVYILPADGEIVPWSSTFGVTHWMPLPEPPKPKEPTFKDKFLEAFPKATVNENGIPCACRYDVFGGGECNEDVSCCPFCWEQPYFEEEEKE